jgi:hypothetical protein
VTRPAWPRLLACLATAATAGSVLVPCAPASAADSATDTATDTPLRVSIETLAPATIPQQGRVTLTGTITNESQRTWTDLNAYLLTSPEPIRSRGELARAVSTDADTPVGSRVADDGLYQRVGDLAPGASTPYRLSVPRRDLGISGENGVYWVGVHVLGADEGGRDSVADGRARTFMPLLPRRGSAAAEQARTRLALVVPLKEPVHRGAAGRLLGLPVWQRTLAPDGRLDRLLRLGRGNRRPVTWAVDPAVLDAAQSVAQGNPPLDLSPSPGRTPSGGGDPQNGSSPSGTPSSTESPGSQQSAGSGVGQSGTPGPAAEPSSAALAARRWLAEFRRQATTRTVAALPYGDLDVASVLAQPRSPRVQEIYRRAARLGRATLASNGVQKPSDLVAPSTGFLPNAALRRVTAPATVLLEENAFPQAKGPVVNRGGGAPVVLTDGTAGAGGPAPNSQYAALEVRQRLLSEAALHALSPARDTPLVVSTPAYWNPGDAWSTSRFFSGLDQPWLQLVDLTSVVATSSSDPGDDVPVYPAADRLARVPVANLQATDAVIRAGQVLARLLTDNDTVDDTLARAGMLSSSMSARADPDTARNQAVTTGEYVRAQTAQVRVEGPGFVMMSGESGPIQVTLVNDLDQTVTVGLKVTTPGSDLTFADVPPETLGPGRRTSVRLEATSHDIGVHAVTLLATDEAGAPLGSQARFSVRSSNVSTVIWVIMAVGGALLLVAIVIRLIRRLRRRKSTHGPLLPRDTTGRTGQEVDA